MKFASFSNSGVISWGIVEGGENTMLRFKLRDAPRETGPPVSVRPTLFTRHAGSLLGHGDDIVRPHVSTMLEIGSRSRAAASVH